MGDTGKKQQEHAEELQTGREKENGEPLHTTWIFAIIQKATLLAKQKGIGKNLQKSAYFLKIFV